jgi:chemotaxis protein histidine kinase CheA
MNRFLFLVVVVVSWGRRLVAVVVDDLLDAPLLLTVLLLMTRARVSGLIVPWLVEDGLLLLIIDHHPLSLRIHLFG